MGDRGRHISTRQPLRGRESYNDVQTEKDIRNELTEMALSSNDRLEAKEKELRMLEQEHKALQRGFHEQQQELLELRSARSAFVAKQSEVEKLKEQYRELQRAFEGERAAKDSLAAVKVELEEEAEARSQTVKQLEKQVDDLKGELEGAKVVTPEVLERFLKQFSSGLSHLGSAESTGKMDAILSNLEQLHSKVDRMSETLGEVHYTTGFLATMSVRTARHLDAITSNELDMPKLLRLMPLGPTDLSSLWKSEEERKRFFQQDSGRKGRKRPFCGGMGAAARMLGYQLGSKFKETWEVQFLCSHDLTPVKTGLTFAVPKGWLIKAYPFMKVMIGLILMARVASSTVDRLFTNAGLGEMPSSDTVFNMLHVIEAMEDKMPDGVLREFEGELTSKLQDDGEESRKELQELTSHMYLQLIEVLDFSNSTWRTELSKHMRKVIGEDGSVYWVSLANLPKFTAPEAVQGRLMSLQQQHTQTMQRQYARVLERTGGVGPLGSAGGWASQYAAHGRSAQRSSGHDSHDSHEKLEGFVGKNSYPTFGETSLTHGDGTLPEPHALAPITAGAAQPRSILTSNPHGIPAPAPALHQPRATQASVKPPDSASPQLSTEPSLSAETPTPARATPRSPGRRSPLRPHITSVFPQSGRLGKKGE